MKVSRSEALKYIEDFLPNRGGEWDWDDFTSIPIDDPELERLRYVCASLRDIYPPVRPDQYCNDEGVRELRRLAALLREGKPLP